MTLEEKFKVIVKKFNATTTNNGELKNQNPYLEHQLAGSMRQKRRNLFSSSSSPICSQQEWAKRNNAHLVWTSEEETPKGPRRRERRPQPSFNDFKVDIPEF